MPYLIESNEWRLLQGLALLLEERKARYILQTEGLKDHRGHPNAELLEVELRRTFMIRVFPEELELTEFGKYQAKLSRLCSLLNGLALPQSNHDSRENQVYPRLRALTRHLQSTSGVVDLINGSKENLFRLPNDDVELRDCLSVVAECNDALSRLLPPPPQEPDIRPLQRQPRKEVWKKARIRNRAMFVLGTLYENFKCGTPHEVLLKLIEDSDDGSLLPNLQLMLSPCPDSELWQEVRCDSVILGETSISSISDICTDLQQHSGQGNALMLLIESYGLFGAWENFTSTETNPLSKESLDQLIMKGAFKPRDLATLFHGESTAKFSTKDKRELAVKLGFCLMDFFDADLTSKRIYFLGSFTSDLKKELPYLAFSSKLPATANPYNFRMGHPALLSFAKLLLEIEFGQSIDLDISLQNNQNQTAWARLLDLVDQLEEERSDSYLQAVKGSLLVHRKIAQALRSHDLKGKEADLRVRKELYKEVVYNLELGLSEFIPKPSHKRQRSESPTPSDCWDGAQGAGSGKMTMQSMEPERTVPEFKRQHIPDPQQSSFPYVSHLTLGESSGLFDDNTPSQYPADLCQFADNFLSRHRLIYNNVIRLDDTSENRVKVAILDSGLDMDHPIIRTSHERIRDVRTWINGLQGQKEIRPQDYCGHGTHVTSLFLDIAPDCDVYIAHVADSRPVVPADIAKAINHAIQVWGVDIISMSFGYVDETEPGCDELRGAITAAHAGDVLIFAAASNSGAHSTEPAFPARVSNVFCIYAGDGMGNSGRANPTPRKHLFNFLTLGEAVEGAWPHTLSEYPWKLRKSGTSFATPIAAAIAAFLLLYARQDLRPDDAKRFKQYDKMRDLLFHLSHERNGYNVISPEEFFRRAPAERKSLMMSLLDGKSWK